MLDLPFVSDLSPLSHPESCPTMSQKLLSCADTPRAFFYYSSSVSAPIHIVPTLLGFYLLWKHWNSSLLFSSVFSAILHDTWFYAIIWVFFLPPSFNFSRPIQSVFAQHITSIVLPGLALLYGCYGPEKSAFVSDTISSNGCSQSLSSLCISYLQPEEKKNTPSLPHLPVCSSELLTGWGFWLLLGKTIIPVFKKSIEEGLWHLGMPFFMS